MIGRLRSAPESARRPGRASPALEHATLRPTSERPERLRGLPTGSPRQPRPHVDVSAPEALDPEPLLRFLHDKGVRHIIIGGVAVAAHGYARTTKDLDVVPRPDWQNLARLAGALVELHAIPAELGDFAANEVPMDATNPDDLAAGGNFRIETDLGALDVMQWVAGIETDDLYAELEREALGFTLDGTPLRYCGLAHLRAMKQAAGRPRDLDDLEQLPTS